MNTLHTKPFFDGKINDYLFYYNLSRHVVISFIITSKEKDEIFKILNSHKKINELILKIQKILFEGLPFDENEFKRRYPLMNGLDFRREELEEEILGEKLIEESTLGHRHVFIEVNFSTIVTRKEMHLIEKHVNKNLHKIENLQRKIKAIGHSLTKDYSKKSKIRIEKLNLRTLQGSRMLYIKDYY
jgi:hypothetical protein